MTARKTFLVLFLIVFSNVFFLFAGDMASFVDLGFSADGRTYAFAQYGVRSGTLRPWAELFIVDVPRNNFVQGGRLSYVHDSSIAAGQDGSGAFYRLIAGNTSIIERNGINYLNQGQPLFISLDEPNSPPVQSIEFRDFESGAFYRASINSWTQGNGENLTSSFEINLERTARDGSRRTYTVGTPSVRRPQIVSYRIRKVITAPNNDSMILLIEMKRQNGADFDIRFMVEALRL